jgi:hypothetical protein
MKRLLLVLTAAILSTCLYAQSPSIVGKWKVASVKAGGVDIDMENPASIKKMLADQIQKEGGQAPDSATLNMAYTMVTGVFEKMQFEFTQDGKGVISVPDETGTMRQETATYKVDYASGVLSTTSKENGKEKKEDMKIRFEGEYMWMTKGNGQETIKLRRVK